MPTPSRAAKRGAPAAADTPREDAEDVAGPSGAADGAAAGNIVPAPRLAARASAAAAPAPAALGGAKRARLEWGAAAAGVYRPVGLAPKGDGPCEMEGGRANGQWVASGGATGDFGGDPRVTLLFDLNGVLLVNPRKPSGRREPRLRPNIEALARLAGAFRLGVYSSATASTVHRALERVTARVRAAASVAGAGGPAAGGRLFDVVLCRRYCRPAPKERLDAGGNEWDTVKPLAMHFGGPTGLARVVLVDNDAHKALPGEAANMLLVPTWDGVGDARGDTVLTRLADALLCPASGLVRGGDVRERTAAVAARVAADAAADAAVAAAAAGGAEAGVAAAAVAPADPAAPAAAQPAAADAANQLPPSKKATKRAAKEAKRAAAAAAAAGVAAGAASGVATVAPPAPTTPPTDEATADEATAALALDLPDELSAWKTVTVLAVHELSADSARGTDAAAVEAYARFKGGAKVGRAVWSVKAVKAAFKQLAAKKALVPARPPQGARVTQAALLKAFRLAPGTATPDGGVEATFRALARADKGKEAELVRQVVLACVADLTAAKGPALKMAMKHLTKRFGRPSFCSAAQLLSRLQIELEEELRIEATSFGPGAPKQLAGLRCMSVPTDTEVTAAVAVLKSVGRKGKGNEPPISISGTLAGVAPDALANNVVPFERPQPAVAAAPGEAQVVLTAPLPVFEDFGPLADGGDAPLPAPQATEEGDGAAHPAAQAGDGATQSGTGVEAPPTGQTGAPSGDAAENVDAAAGGPSGAEAVPSAPVGRNWWDPAPQATDQAQAVNAAPVTYAPPSPLHAEILDFMYRAAPTQHEARIVQSAVDAVSRTAASLWPQSRTLLFGSQATGLALPGSDLDIVVLGASEDLQNPATGFSWDQRRILTDRLRSLLKALRKAGLVAGKALVIKARVPIIKCALRLGVQIDVSLGAVNGAAAVEFVQRQVMTLPPLRPLVLVIKAVLKEAGLNEVFRGGLSSYCTTLMAIAHLLAEGVDADPGASDCGRLLWSFFDRYGRRFDYQRQAVRVSRGGVAPKPLDWVKPDRVLALAVEDPQEEGKDIGSGSFNIAAVRDCFARAADALAAAVAGGGGARGGGARGGGGDRAAAAWAMVQAEGASRSVRQPVLLASLLNVDLAVCRSAGASEERARRAGGPLPLPVPRPGPPPADRTRHVTVRVPVGKPAGRFAAARRKVQVAGLAPRLHAAGGRGAKRVAGGRGGGGQVAKRGRGRGRS